MAHLLLHVHTDLVELGAHEGMAGNRGEIRPVHHVRHMVAGDGPPVGNAGGAMLIAAGIAPIGIALGVADEDGDVAIEHVFIHQHRIPPAGDPQIHHMVIVLAVVAGDLMGIVKLVEQLHAQDLLHFRDGGPGMQAVGEHEQYVLLLHPARV